MVERLALRLEVSAGLRSAFVADAAAARERSPAPPNMAADAACVLVEPIHRALLALVLTEGFRPDTRLLARVLDSDVDLVNVAVQRLASLGLVVMESAERWSTPLSADDVTSAGFETRIWEHATRRIAEHSVAVPTRATTAHDEEPMDSKQSPVRQFQFIARDPAKVAAFYEHLFGWTVNDANAFGYRTISTGTKGIDGGIWPAPPDARPFVQLFVEVDDIAAAVERALQLGAKVVVPPQALPDGDEMSVLVDPEGLSFGIFRPATSRRAAGDVALYGRP